jgi:hypothetical protein
MSLSSNKYTYKFSGAIYRPSFFYSYVIIFIFNIYKYFLKYIYARDGEKQSTLLL